MMVGSFEYVIDEKGRLFIPAKFREEIGESIVLFMDGAAGCLVGYSQQRMEKIRENIDASPRSVKTGMRNVFYYAMEAVPDKQGRITISPELRKLAGLDSKSEVIIIGSMSNIEIWSKSRIPDMGTGTLPDNIGL